MKINVNGTLTKAAPVVIGVVAAGALLFYGGHLPVLSQASKGLKGETNSGKFLGIF